MEDNKSFFVENRAKLLALAGSVALTLAIHYGFVLEPLFGPSHWGHAIHGRFCYIPIVIAASWFGLRGGLTTAAIISAAVLPYLFLQVEGAHDISSEIVEIIFYFAIASLTGALVDREILIRRKHDQARTQLQRSQQLSLIGQMAAGFAHEIKNPLASIKGAIEIISDPATATNDRAEFEKVVKSEIKRIDNTVSDYLQFARPTETKKSRIDLSEVIGSTVRQLEPQANRNKIELKSEITPDTHINADEEKIRQVILNITLNAIQAMEDGGEIRISLQKKPDHALLTIADNGPGIPTEQADHLFEPFYTTRAKGTGLGLAIAKTIVEEHNGIILFESRIDSGTTFTVLLPFSGDKK